MGDKGTLFNKLNLLWRSLWNPLMQTNHRKQPHRFVTSALLLLLVVSMTAGCGQNIPAGNATTASTSAAVSTDGSSAVTDGSSDNQDAEPSATTSAATADPTATTSAATADPAVTTSAATAEPDTTTSAATAEPSASERSGTRFPDFEMTTLTGEKVDQSIFAEKDLTMVNIWATSCPPCINEMPDLGKLSEVMQSDYNAQLIGIVVDVRDEDTLNLASEILSQSEAKHMNLLPDEGVFNFLSQYEYVPTTLFIDKEGYLLTKPVVGGHSYGDYLVMVKDLVKQMK